MYQCFTYTYVHLWLYIRGTEAALDPPGLGLQSDLSHHVGVVNGIQFLWKCSTFEQTLWPLILFLRKQLLPFDVALRFFLSPENHQGAKHPLVGITLGWNFSEAPVTHRSRDSMRESLQASPINSSILLHKRAGSEAGHGASSEK